MRRPGGPRAAFSSFCSSLVVLLAASTTVFGSSASAVSETAAPGAADLSPATAAPLARRHGVAAYGDRTASIARSSTAQAAPVRTAANAAGVPHLSYYGGPVVSTVTVHPVLFGSSASYAPQLQPGAAAPNVTTFLQNFLTSSAFTWLNEYDTNITSHALPPAPGTNQHIVAGSAVAPVTMTPTTASKSLIDTEVQNQLRLAIGRGELPAPTADAGGHATSIYSVFMPAGYRVCLEVDSVCSLEAGGFCAYHGAFTGTNGVEVLYTLQPDLASVAPGGAGLETGSCGPVDPFAVLTAKLSHEIVETVTDPEGPVAKSLGPPLGWYDFVTTGLGEITDICDVHGRFVGGDSVNYVVQGQWSNRKGACIVDYVQPPLTPPAPTSGNGSALDTSAPVARLLDTRPAKPVGPQGVVTIHTTATNASAVVLNVTATGATSSTYVSVYPCDQGRPPVSSLNVTAGDTVANLVTVQVSAGGDVCAFNNAGTVHLVVDQMATYQPVDNPVATGRLVAVTPARALDTRLTTKPFGAGEDRVIDLTAVGVPDNALAVVLTVTAPDALGPGYWAVWPSGAWPGTSSLNLSARNQTRANQSVVPLDVGKVKVKSQIGGHLVIDVAGWFTGTGGAVSTKGLFHPVSPDRGFGTRAEDPGGDGSPVTDLTLGTTLVADPGATAIVLNVTATEPTGAGFLTVYPAGAPLPTASNLNFARGVTVPGHVIAGLDADALKIHTNVATHVIVDVFGWYS